MRPNNIIPIDQVLRTSICMVNYNGAFFHACHLSAFNIICVVCQSIFNQAEENIGIVLGAYPADQGAAGMVDIINSLASLSKGEKICLSVYNS